MPNLKPVCDHIWKNGARISAYILEKAMPDHHKSDVIRLDLCPAGKEPSTFYMNIEDANAIIHCLAAVSGVAIMRRESMGPDDAD